MFILRCNTLSKVDYLKELIFCVVLAMIWYMNLCFKGIIGITTEYSIELLVGFTAIYICVIYELSSRWNRNRLSIFESVSIPFGIYSFISGFYNFSTLVKVRFIICFLICGLVCLLTVYFLRRIGSKKFVLGIQILYIIIRTIVAIGSIIIIIISAYNSKHSYTENKKYDSHKSFVVEDNFVDDKMEILSKIYDDKWVELDHKERLEVLNCYSNVDGRFLGLSSNIPVKAGYLDDNTAGWYVEDEHTIYIAADVLASDKTKYILEVLLHEMYHAAQHRYIEIYESLGEEDREILFMQNANSYAEEFDNYITANGHENYDAYYNQKCEADAREYSLEGAIDYFLEIEKRNR